MKAVLHRMVPGMPAIDLFADAPVGNPKASAYLLAAYADWFAARTVFLGRHRRHAPIILEADGRWYVAWHLARSKALSVGLSNAYFRSLGLLSLFDAR